MVSMSGSQLNNKDVYIGTMMYIKQHHMH